MLKEANKIKSGLILFLILILIQSIYGHEETTDPGILPDSILWGLDKAFDSLSLALTFNSDEKAKKGISIAMERIAEVKLMLEQNKIEHSLKAKKATSDTLLKVKERISIIEKEDKTQELESTLEIENELNEVEEELKELKETEIKIKIKGDLSPEKLQQLESIVSDLLGTSGELKVEIKNKKDKTKIEIKAKGIDENKLELELEEKHGLLEKKKHKAEEEIEDAKEGLEEVEEIVAEGVPQGILEILNEARKKIENAENALAEGKFGEAFGQANAAKNILKNAEKKLEAEEEKELEIEAEIKEGFTKVKVELDEEELEFTLATTNKDEILSAIAENLGMTVEEIRTLVDFEDEELEEELKKLKKKDIPGEKPDFDKIFDDEDKDKENLEEELKESIESGEETKNKGNSGKYNSNGKSSGKEESKLESDEENDDNNSY